MEEVLAEVEETGSCPEEITCSLYTSNSAMIDWSSEFSAVSSLCKAKKEDIYNSRPILIYSCIFGYYSFDLWFFDTSLND